MNTAMKKITHTNKEKEIAEIIAGDTDTYLHQKEKECVTI